ncbi:MULTISPECIES: hypothetical protein [unclassified Bacillus (in: firmicutes)]|uniref:hypothetical protein n=1 Tax=unclassified Bacillus (in: firmicutes) TaxID=185979 RepID=UPI0008E2ACD1|nr:MULTISPECIES: hypothetical protein [unclassified Bacillus (in: firmicutes)]SFA97933.1 hypothetical protein SAMN02799634_103300 [Bacillus sp. UNCCL13]SFQ80731.1 hypothetical protein SAMN04488577_1930 [Bacillus sp. cl95]
MLIKECKGYELEKEKSNTSEDFFNRSEVVFNENGQTKTLHILYLRYFDELAQEITGLDHDPLFTANAREVTFKDVVAVVCLLKNPDLRNRKRLYINSKHEMASYFKDVDLKKLPTIFESLDQKGGYPLDSPLSFIVQTN